MKNFFIKHKTKLLIIGLVIAAASLLTAVTIALWNNDEDVEPIYNIPVNPNEKYLEYYFVVENPSSPIGFDYYPESRLPNDLEVEGVAVSRYSGFMTEVSIPAYYKGYPVIHLLASNDYVNNGFGLVNKVTVPETMTYIATDALNDECVLYVLGKEEYIFEDLRVESDEIEIKNGETLVDKLVLVDGLYLSTITLDTYPITENTIDYECGVSSITVNGASYVGEFKELARISGDFPSSTTFENENLRKNTLTYSLSSEDLFGNDSGMMISDGMSSYHRYIITNTLTTITIGSDSEELEAGYKYLVSYDNSQITATKYIYEINGEELILDLDNSNYESYVTNLNLDGNINVTLNDEVIYSKENTLTGLYEVTYSPNVFLADLSTYTNLSINEIYYLYEVNENNEVSETLVDFILPNDLGTTYYALYDNNSYQLNKMFNSHYYLNLTEEKTLKIVGYNNEELVFESQNFAVSLKNTYDLVNTLSDLVLETINYDAGYDLKVNLPSSYKNKELKVLATLTYYDVHNGFSKTVDSTVEFTKNCDQYGDFVLSYSDYNFSPLGYALALSNEYVVTQLTLSLKDGETLLANLYEYDSNDVILGSSKAEFYGKEYKLFNTISNGTPTTLNYEISLVDTLNRNYANTLNKEYYYLVDTGNYFVSKDNSITTLDGIDLYSVTGNKVLQYTSEEIKDSNIVLLNGISLINIGDDFYQGLGHLFTPTLPSATYFVYFDGQDYSYRRIEGSKKYYISADNQTFIEMKLNVENTDYEEYIVESFSLPTSKVYIKSDLDSEATEYTLSIGLHNTISFSVDNRRRKENNYEIFKSVKSDLNENSVCVFLSDGINNVTYYLPSDDLTLPNYEEVFTLNSGERFLGWKDSEDNIVTVGISGSTYTAVITKYVTIPSGLGYVVTDELGQKLDTLELNDTFKVIVNRGYSLISVKNGEFELEAIDGIYTLTTISDTKLNINCSAETYTIDLDPNGGTLNDTTVSVTYGEHHKLDVPAGKDGFLYYYSEVSGIVYTDNLGNVVSPYLIDSNLTLKAIYTNQYYLVINKYDTEGNLIADSSATLVEKGMVVKDYFPRIPNKHYSSISVYQTTNGYPVEFDIYEYEHMYSFVMPSANVVINITYKDNNIAGTSASGNKTTLYALIPLSFANNVKIYDSTISNYVDMTRLDHELQIYQGLVAYEIKNFDKANESVKISANGYESYIYELDYTNNLLIVDNFSLENEVHLLTNWIDITKSKNTYTINSEFDSVVAINGTMSISGKVVTVKKALNKTNSFNYQHASFEVVLKTAPIKLSFIVNYDADGSIESPILINDAADFNYYMCDDVFSHMSGLNFLQTTESITVEDGNNYKVVFNRNYPFNHTYDAVVNTNKIIYVQNELRDNVNNGLFGYIGPNGTIKNLLIDYDILNPNSVGGYISKSYIGAVASVNEGTIDNVGTESKNISGNNLQYVGGIVGINSGTIKNCKNRINYTLYNYGVADSNILGGICGYNSGTIIGSINVGSQSIQTQTNKEIYSGDFVGLNRGTANGNYYGQVNKAEVLTKKTLYFTVPSGWIFDATYGEYLVYAYAWNSKTEKYNQAFPGETMTWVVDVKNDSGNVYEKIYKIDVDYDYDYVIFNGQKDFDTRGQTANISIGNVSSHTQFYFDPNKTDGSVIALQLPNGVGHGSTAFEAYSNYKFRNVSNGTSLGTIYKSKHNNQIAIFDVKMTKGQEYELVTKDGARLSNYTISENSGLSYENGKIICNTTGTYSIYFNFKPQLASQPIKAIFVDDWWFDDKEFVTDKGTYYLKTAIKVDCFDSNSNKIGTLVYSGDQIYQSNGMNAVMVDVFSGSSRVDISRVILINNYGSGMDRFYFSYDEAKGFEKINNQEFISYPEDTYKVSIDVSASIPTNAYIYAINSQVKYATKNVSNNKGHVITSDRDIIGYVDVTGLEDYDNYRVIYLNGKNEVAARSYNPNEQVQLLNGVTEMIFEVSYDGAGLKRIASVNPNDIEDTLVFTPKNGVSQEKGEYALRIGEKLLYLYENPTKDGEYMITGVEIKTTDKVEVVRVVDDVITPYSSLTKDSYTTNYLSISNDKLVVSNHNNYDIYFTPTSKKIYASVAKVYELVTDDSTIRMYTNPKDNKEVMATGLEMTVGQTLKLRVVGNQNHITGITLKDSSVSGVSLSNGVISFTENITVDIYIDKSDESRPAVYVGQATASTYNVASGEITNTIYDPVTPSGREFSFIPLDLYESGRVYYLNSNDEVIGYYEFTNETTKLPCIDEATSLYIVRINNGYELNKIYVNSIYENHTLKITSPYYGYYDASWLGNIDDKNYIYFKSNSESATLIYTLNDGRIGEVLMDSDGDYHKLDWAKVIGLNPKTIAFKTSNETTPAINLKTINIGVGNCYSYIEGQYEVSLYDDYNHIYLYVDSNAPLWNEYFVLVDGISYKMEEISSRNYYAYVPLKLTNEATFKFTSDPYGADLIETDNIEFDSLNNYYVIRSIGSNSGSVIEKYPNSESISEYNVETVYDYYLLGSFNGYETMKAYGMSKYNGKYYGFVSLSEEATYQIASITGTLPRGKHMLVYDETEVKVYSNELTYTVTYVYGANSFVQVYKFGDQLVLPQFDVDPQNIYSPQIVETDKYTFTFDYWTYNGQRIDSGYNVVSDMTLYALYQPKIKTYIITFVSNGNEKDFTADYGESIKSIVEGNYDGNKAQYEYANEVGWFKGWHIDEKYNISAENLRITSDVTLYAKWYLAGFYIVGVMEGYTDWEEPQRDYRLNFIEDNNPGQDQYEIENVFLEQNDEVKIKEIKASGSEMEVIWHHIWSKGTTPTTGENEENLSINKNGYYSFYLHWDGYADKGTTYITFKEFIINLDKNDENAIINGDASEAFDLAIGKTLLLYTEGVDEEPNSTDKKALPTVTNINNLVLFGWFNREVGGERITSITRDMMDNRNSITLYAQYILGGYYFNGNEDLIDETNSAPREVRLNKGETITINYFCGSVHGSSPLVKGQTVFGDNNLSIDGNVITVNETGTYKIYIEGGKLYIDQYHDIVYISGPIGTVEQLSRYEIQQKYGEELYPLDTPNSYNFVGWLKDDESSVYSGTISSNATYYALYQYNDYDNELDVPMS